MGYIKSNFSSKHHQELQDFDLVGFTFGDDGKKLYVVGQDSGSVHGFDLDTAYDLSSITKFRNCLRCQFRQEIQMMFL